MDLPRYVTIDENDKLVWDEEKITMDVDKDIQKEDELLVKNVLKGRIISPNVYPLIFDKGNNCRSLEFYRKVLCDKNIYHSLDDDDLMFFLTGLRDLMIAHNRSILSGEEVDLVKNVINIVDKEPVSLNVAGLDVTPFPSVRHKMLRYISDLNIEDNYFKQFFIKVGDLHLVFINPEDLSYHNFENIVNLEKYFSDGCHFEINNFEKLDVGIWRFDLVDSGNKFLPIDEMNIYLQPFNHTSRGGKRLIFMSETLGKELTETLKKSGLIRELIDVYEDEELEDWEIEEMKNESDENFKRINNVFRYNKFIPGDQKFLSHYDTPYVDSSEKEISKFTLLIYMTSGENKENPVLKIQDYEINSIKNENSFTCIIFDQDYEHEANPYKNNEKIFIRSELIYYDDTIKIGEIPRKLFNIACYMTKESIFCNELNAYSSRLFNQTARARSGYKIDDQSLVLLHKKLLDVNYMTNGDDYWFTKHVDLKMAAVLVIVDYFNGRIGSDGKTETVKLIKEKYSEDDIYKHLSDYNNSFENEEVWKKICGECDNSSFVPENIYDMELKGHISDDDYKDPEGCCPGHTGMHIDPFRSKSVVEDWKGGDKVVTIEKHAKVGYDSSDSDSDHFVHYEDEINLNDYSVSLFNGQVFLNLEDINVEEKFIQFKTTGSMGRINFAACFGRYYDYVKTDNVKEKAFKMPPIYYNIEEGGYHLQIDMFNNGFIKEEKVVVKTNPNIVSEPQDDYGL